MPFVGRRIRAMRAYCPAHLRRLRHATAGRNRACTRASSGTRRRRCRKHRHVYDHPAVSTGRTDQSVSTGRTGCARYRASARASSSSGGWRCCKHGYNDTAGALSTAGAGYSPVDPVSTASSGSSPGDPASTASSGYSPVETASVAGPANAVNAVTTVTACPASASSSSTAIPGGQSGACPWVPLKYGLCP